MTYVARDLKDVANLVARKLEDYMNNERVEARFQPLGCYRTTKKMQNFDLLTRVMECSDLDYMPAQNMKRKKSPTRKLERHKSPDGKLKKKSKSLKKDQSRERRAASMERKKVLKDKPESSLETDSEKLSDADKRGEREEKNNTKEAKIVKKETWMRLIDAKEESPVDHKLKINPKLDKTTRTVVAKKEAARLSEYASHVFEKQPLDKLQVIHRYRPHSQDIPHLTENGKVQNYTCHVGSALHTKQYVDYYMKEGLQTGKKEYSKRLKHLKTRDTGSEQGSEKSANSNASRSAAILKNGDDSHERKRGKLPPIRSSDCISPRSTLSTDSHDSSVSRYTASSFSSGLTSTYKIVSTPRNRPTTAAQSYPNTRSVPLQPHPPIRPRNMEITTKIEFRPSVRQAFVESGSEEIPAFQMLDRASSTSDLLPMLDTFTQTPRDDMSEQSLKVLTVSGDSSLDQETQTPRSITHKKKKKKKEDSDTSHLEGYEVPRPHTRARRRRHTGVSSVSEVNLSMTESSICDSTSVSASDASLSQASYTLDSARVVKPTKICQTSFSLPSESLYTTESSFTQQSDQSTLKEPNLRNPMVSDNLSSLPNSTMHIYKSSSASAQDSEEQNERYASSGVTQEIRAEMGNSEEYYSYDRAGEKDPGNQSIGEKEREETPQNETMQVSSRHESVQSDDDPFWEDIEKDTVVSYGSSIMKPCKMDDRKDWSTELKSQSKYGTPRTPEIITVVNTPRDEAENLPDDTVINDTSVEEACRGNVDLPEVDEDPRGDTLFSSLDETKETYVGNFIGEKTQSNNFAYRKIPSDYCYVPEDRGMDGESYVESETESEMYIKSSIQTANETKDDEDLDISRGVIPPKRKVSDASSYCSAIRAVGEGSPIYRQEIFERPPSRCSQVSSVRGSGKSSSIPPVPDETLNENIPSLNETQDLLTEDELTKMIEDLKIIDDAPPEKADFPKRSPSSCSRGSGDVPFSGQSSFLRGIEETSPEEENMGDNPVEQFVEQSEPESRGNADVSQEQERDASEPPAETASDTSSCRGYGLAEVCSSGVSSRGNEAEKNNTDDSTAPKVKASVTEQQEDVTKEDLFESKVQDISSFEYSLQCASSPQGLDDGSLVPTPSECKAEDNVTQYALKDEQIDEDLIVKPDIERNISNQTHEDNPIPDNNHDDECPTKSKANETQDLNDTQGGILDKSCLSTTRGSFTDESSILDATARGDTTADHQPDVALPNGGSPKITVASTGQTIPDDSKITDGLEERTKKNLKEPGTASEFCQDLQTLSNIEVEKRSCSVNSPRKPRSVSGRPGGHCPDSGQGNNELKPQESECLENTEDNVNILNESRGSADNVIEETIKMLVNNVDLECPQDASSVGNNDVNTFLLNESRGLFENEDLELLKEKPASDKDQGSVDEPVAATPCKTEIENSEPLIHNGTDAEIFNNTQTGEDSQEMNQHETGESRDSENAEAPEDPADITANYSMERGETTDTPREMTIIAAPRLQRSPSVCSRGSVSEECPVPCESSKRMPEENPLPSESEENTLPCDLSESKPEEIPLAAETLEQNALVNGPSGENPLSAEASNESSDQNPTLSNPSTGRPSSRTQEENPPASEPSNETEDNHIENEPSNKSLDQNINLDQTSNETPEENPSTVEETNHNENPSPGEPSNKENPSIGKPTNGSSKEDPNATELTNETPEKNTPAVEQSNEGPEEITGQAANDARNENQQCIDSSNSVKFAEYEFTETTCQHPDEEPSSRGTEDTVPSSEDVSSVPTCHQEDSTELKTAVCADDVEEKPKKKEYETGNIEHLTGEKELTKNQTDSKSATANMDSNIPDGETDHQLSNLEIPKNQPVIGNEETVNGVDSIVGENKIEPSTVTNAGENEKADEIQNAIRKVPYAQSIGGDNGEVDDHEDTLREGDIDEDKGNVGEITDPPVGSIEEDSGKVDEKMDFEQSVGTIVENNVHDIAKQDNGNSDETINEVNRKVDEHKNTTILDVEKHDACMSSLNFFAEEGDADVQKEELSEQRTAQSPEPPAEEQERKESIQSKQPVNFFTGDESAIFSPNQTFLHSSMTGDSTMYLSAESTETTATSDSSKIETSTPENLQYVTLQPESPEGFKSSEESELTTASKLDEDASKQIENIGYSRHSQEAGVSEPDENREIINDSTLQHHIEENEQFTRVPGAHERRMSVESRGSRCSEQETTLLSSPRADGSFMDRNFSILPDEAVPQSEQFINGSPINDMTAEQTDVREKEKPITYSNLSSVLVLVEQTQASNPADEKISQEPSPKERYPEENEVYPPSDETTTVDIAVLPQAISKRGSDNNEYHSFLDGKNTAESGKEEKTTEKMEKQMRDISCQPGETTNERTQKSSVMHQSDMDTDNVGKIATQISTEENVSASSNLSNNEQSVLLVSDKSFDKDIPRSLDKENILENVASSSSEIIDNDMQFTDNTPVNTDRLLEEEKLQRETNKTPPNAASVDTATVDSLPGDTEGQCSNTDMKGLYTFNDAVAVEDNDAASVDATKEKYTPVDSYPTPEIVSVAPVDGSLLAAKEASTNSTYASETPDKIYLVQKHEAALTETPAYQKEEDYPERGPAKPKFTSSLAKNGGAPEEKSSLQPNDIDTQDEQSSQQNDEDIPNETSAHLIDEDASEEPFAHPNDDAPEEMSAHPEEIRGGEEEDLDDLATSKQATEAEDCEGGESETMNTHETREIQDQTDIVETSGETKGSGNGKRRVSADECAGTNGNLMPGHKIILVSENVPPPFPKAKIIGNNFDGSKLILVSEKPQV